MQVIESEDPVGGRWSVARLERLRKSSFDILALGGLSSRRGGRPGFESEDLEWGKAKIELCVIRRFSLIQIKN
jgi:hypothetical protein